MNRTFAAVAVIAIVAAAGLIYLGITLQPSEQPEQELHSIVKDGVEYMFNSNIYDSIKVPLYDKSRIYDLLAVAPRIWILFHDNAAENSYVAAASVGLTSKLAHYYAYTQGRMVNITGVELSQIGNRTLTGVFVEFRGPATGANETSVRMERGKIIVQALNITDLMLVSDRLSLAIFEDDLRAMNITIPEIPELEQPLQNASNNS